VSAREVLRDLRTERGETPAADPYDELLEAAELQREGTPEPDPVARELASQVLDEAGAAECLRALFPGFRPKT
jgi:hypothetical protein